MEKVFFANKGTIDLDVIRVMGVSVKENENPIGFFGTGLKFAIATLLRTGHSIDLYRNGVRIPFEVRQENIRGKEFGRVYMDGVSLPFTTELGRTWEVWQAYRELHSNTLDENGTITDDAGCEPVSKGDTVFVIGGTSFHSEYLNRHNIFVSGKPIATAPGLEVYSGRSKAVFYRGVRCGFLPEECEFTYNITTEMQLSEDRMFASQWDLEYKLGTMIPSLPSEDVAAQLLDGTKAWDQNLNFCYADAPSQQFLKAATDRYADQNGNKHAKMLVDRERQKQGDFPPAQMTDADHEKLLAAFTYLPKLDCTLSPEDVEMVETLGPDILAMHHRGRGQIYMAKTCLDYGMETIVATLYEEWLHKEFGYRDESRSLQTFLFQRLVALSMGDDGPKPQKQSRGLLF